MTEQKTGNSNGQPQLTIASAYLQAIEHFNAERYPESDQLCTAIIKAAPNHTNALNLLGVIAQRVSRHDLAVEQFTRAINIDSKKAIFYYNLGVSLNSLGYSEKAQQTLKTALKIEPENRLISECLQKISDIKADSNIVDIKAEAEAALQPRLICSSC
jgi:protein O-GlcNAc transferase